jgi:hypothetical protein
VRLINENGGSSLYSFMQKELLLVDSFLVSR